MSVKKQIVWLSLISIPLMAMADELVIFDAATEYQGEQCEWEPHLFEQNPVVYHIPESKGHRTNYTIDQSGNDVRQIDIAIHQPDRPVILKVNAYDPTIWNIGWTEKTTIIGVYASGYHRQVIAGIQSDVPVIINTYDNGYVCNGSQTLSALNKIKSEDTAQPNKKGFLSIGMPTSTRVDYITNANNSPKSYQLPDHLLSGKAGLIYAVNQGLIRPANQVDFQKWRSAEQKLLDSIADEEGNEGKRRANSLMFSSGDNTYVVLKKFKYPDGLYGGNSVTFIIPKGVPLPEGNPGHSKILDMNSMGCLGPGC